MSQPATLSECLRTADNAEGRKRLKAYLESQPFPHYEPHPEIQGVLIRVDENGRRTAGRFVNRKFQPTKSPRKASAK
jgi:hypothetical protein